VSPLAQYSVLSHTHIASADSKSDVSMYCPRPVFSRAMSAASTPFAAMSPTERSAIGTPHFTGAPPGSPVTLMMPLMP
jgi:hypothetical protein